MPEAIDNEQLLENGDASCARLRVGLRIGRDLVLLPPEAWQLLSGWYGGGPELKRRALPEPELYPPRVVVHRVDQGGHLLAGSFGAGFSRAERVLHVLQTLTETFTTGSSGGSSGAGAGPSSGWRLWRATRDALWHSDELGDLEQWQQLSEDATLAQLGVVDGTRVILDHGPFFHRVRIDYKRRHFKDPRDASVHLTVDDRIDACAHPEEFDSTSAEWVQGVPVWYAATVVDEKDDGVLVQFHDMPKSTRQPRMFESCDDERLKEDVELGAEYLSLDREQNWHPVRIKSQNDNGTYVAEVLDQDTTWTRVFAENMKSQTTLLPGTRRALSKVFRHYASEARIEAGPARGLLSCATNEFVDESCERIQQLLDRPWGDREAVDEAGFLEYWRFRTATQGLFAQQELQRLFARVDAQPEERSEEQRLLDLGRAWIERSSERLAHYRSHTKPSQSSTSRDFKEFRIGDKVDVLFDRWQQGHIDEVNWEEMTVLVRGDGFSRERLPMESPRLAPARTKSMQRPVDRPLLTRSSSQGGQCERPGCCGLKNPTLTTCYLNSTLQCLSNTPQLRLWFTGGPKNPPRFVSHLRATERPTVAAEFSHVLRKMWSNEEWAILPEQLQNLLGQIREGFAQREQQDAQELLAVLLDALHEDTNAGVSEAPSEAPSASSSEPAQELSETEQLQKDLREAERSWAKHTRSNDSRIVELFHFLTRSELRCSSCNFRSPTFDPSMYLSLPVLPKQSPRKVKITLCPWSYPSEPMRDLAFDVPINGTFADLEGRLAQQLDKPRPSDPAKASAMTWGYVFGDVFKERFYKLYPKDTPTKDVQDHENVFAMEVPLFAGLTEDQHDYVQVVFRHKVKTTTSAGQQWKHQNFGQPRIVSIKKGATNTDVHRRLKDLGDKLLKMVPAAELAGCFDIVNVREDDMLVEDDEPFTPKDGAAIDFADAELAQRIDLAKPAVESGRRLRDCLQLFAEQEDMPEAACDKCKLRGHLSKRLHLFSLPEILIVHLKRFGAQDGRLVKHCTAVRCPLELDLGDFMWQRPDAEQAMFELYGVVNHIGTSLDHGHYTAHARVDGLVDGDGPGVWYHFDDVRVSRSSSEEIQPEHAYMLFYRRQSGPRRRQSRTAL